MRVEYAFFANQKFLENYPVHVCIRNLLSLLGLEYNELSKLVLEMFMCMGNTCSYSVMLLSIEWWSVKLDISLPKTPN